MISVDFENVFCSKHGKWLAKEVGLFCPDAHMRKHLVFDKREWNRYGKGADQSCKWANPYQPWHRVSFKLRDYDTLTKHVRALLENYNPILVYDTAIDLKVLQTLQVDNLEIIDVSKLVADRVGQRITLHTALLAFGVDHNRRSLHNPFADSMYTYRLWEKLQSPKSYSSVSLTSSL